MSTAQDPQANALRRALTALDRMQARLEAMRDAAREPVAVVGLGCRFPCADGPEEFARFLESGGDAVSPVPRGRAMPPGPAGFAERAGFLEDIAGFDPGFFGLRDDEAATMDPHQRLLLEVAWEALEDAGAAGGSLAGTRTGVYLGLGAQNSDYSWWLLNDPRDAGAGVIGGTFHSLMAGRLSYLLDLRGPSLVVDAACASALVAVHLACEALRRRECDTALAAAVNLILSPLVSQAVRAGGLLSAAGRCQSFDAAADGFVRGEGCGVLVLKRLSDAVRDNDAVWAVLHGGAVGQDGRSNGLVAPSGPAQEDVLRRALAESGIGPESVGYVEAHATGTLLGDAIEAQALGTVYGAGRPGPLAVGSAKPNLGHLEAASGIAGLIKVILALKRRRIPPTPFLAVLNPDIDPAETNLEVVTALTPWPENAPFAGVSAFGMSGTNAHLIVGPAPARPVRRAADGPRTLTLSARDDGALRALAGRIADALHPGMTWADVCGTLNIGRRMFPNRVTIEAADIEGGSTALRRFADGGPAPAAGSTVAAPPDEPVERLHLPPYPFRRRRFWFDATTAATSAEEILYRVEWRHRSTPAIPRGAPRLLLAGDDGFARRLAPGLSTAGYGVTIIGHAASRGGWAALLDAEPNGEVIYLAEGDLEPSPENLRFAQERSLGGLLHLVQALADGRLRRLRIVGRGGWAGAPVPAMALALGRTVALEHPDLECRRIDLAPDLHDPAHALAAELASDGSEEWVRRTAGGRLVPRLVPLPAAARPFRVRRDACYLVTGGLGGVGREIARWLVVRGARDLMLTGRTARDLPDRTAWEAQGVRVRIEAADAADPTAVATVLGRLDADDVPLAGVFHAAGVTADGLLFRQPWPEFATALRAKAEAAAVLDAATRDRPLDAFVLFSSITALCGLAGAGAYGAANAALGAVARRRRVLGLPALSVLWGTWEGSGMIQAANSRLVTQWEAHGIAPFPPAAGIAALESLLAVDAAEAVAANVDWPKLAGWARQEGSGAELYTDLAPDRPETVRAGRPAGAKAGSHPAPSDLERVVRETVADILDLRADDPALDLPFGDLGLGSLAAIELRTRLAGRLGVPVPATLAFNHPSVAAVVEFLSKRMAAGSPAPAPDDAAARIDRMSEAEAERHLDMLLADLEPGGR